MKILILLLILFFSFFLYGKSLPETRVVNFEGFIKSSPERIYDIAIDAKNQYKWRKDVSKITMNSDGNGWIEHTKQGDIKFTLKFVDRPNSFSLEYQSKNFSGEWVGFFKPEGSGSKVILSEKVTVNNIFFRIISKHLKITENFMKKYFEDLKSEAERDA